MSQSEVDNFLAKFSDVGHDEMPANSDGFSNEFFANGNFNELFRGISNELFYYFGTILHLLK